MTKRTDEPTGNESLENESFEEWELLDEASDEVVNDLDKFAKIPAYVMTYDRFFKRLWTRLDFARLFFERSCRSISRRKSICRR